MKRILLLSCFFVLFPVQAMEIEMEDNNRGCVSETIDNFNETIESTNYSEHNINGGNVCIAGGCVFCVASIVCSELTALAIGTMCCVYGARNYAASWNATTVTSSNNYVRAVQNSMRWLFCLEMSGMGEHR